MDTKKKLVFQLMIIAGSVAIGYYFGLQKKSKPQIVTTQTRHSQEKPLAEIEINQEFSYPLPDAEEESEDIKINLTEGQKIKKITNQGEEINAGENNAFLIISIEIENTQDSAIDVNSQNLFRLVKDGKKYAPDLYNDILTIPPLSVQKDELGFVIPEKENKFTILVGPINQEEKDEVIINL